MKFAFVAAFSAVVGLSGTALGADLARISHSSALLAGYEGVRRGFGHCWSAWCDGVGFLTTWERAATARGSGSGSFDGFRTVRCLFRHRPPAARRKAWASSHSFCHG